MATFTEGRHALENLLYEADAGYSRGRGTILSGSGKLDAGTVLGRVTASGKLKPATAAGADGGQTAVAILAYAVDATSADADAVLIERHAIWNDKTLIFDPSVDDATKRGAKLAQLSAVGILAR